MFVFRAHPHLRLCSVRIIQTLSWSKGKGSFFKMSFQKLTTWFLSEKGKKFSYLLAGTVTTGVFFATSVPQTLLLDQYRQLICLYNKGYTVPLSKQLSERFEKVLDTLETERYDKMLYKPFYAYGFDVVSAGTSYSHFGVIVGLPKNFSYQTVSSLEADKHQIKLGEQSIIWESEEGKQLAKSLVYSEDAQMYAMAREIKYRQTLKPLIDILLPTTSCLLVYSLSSNVNRKFNMYTKPLVIRAIGYSLIGAFVFGIYALIKDSTQVYLEMKIDKELMQNKIFKEGGREFYTKLLERNKAMRKILGVEGERLYSVYGNERYFLRTKHLPLVQRKAYFEQEVGATTEPHGM